jgi:hypothetical protein
MVCLECLATFPMSATRTVTSDISVEVCPKCESRYVVDPPKGEEARYLAFVKHAKTTLKLNPDELFERETGVETDRVTRWAKADFYAGYDASQSSSQLLEMREALEDFVCRFESDFVIQGCIVDDPRRLWSPLSRLYKRYKAALLASKEGEGQ